MTGSVVFDNVSKAYGDTRAVDGVSFEIDSGQFFSILGPSGCGKTTLLRLVAGFERPDSGRILIDGQDITGLPPNHRPVNTVFQNYALFPHLSVWDNIAFGLRIARRPEEEIKREVEKMLHLTQLEQCAHKMPHSSKRLWLLHHLLLQVRKACVRVLPEELGLHLQECVLDHP